MMHSVVIATFNRADDLRETLGSLAGLLTQAEWEVVVVDNNSTDHTRVVIEEAARCYPRRLRYLFEPKQGRSAALNAGFRSACGDIILTTDDDVRVPPDWLEQASDGLRRFDCAFVGGRVLPIWGGPRPDWLPETSGRHWGPIALCDFGADPVEFANRAPLGVNMALRREALARAGAFDNLLGRKAGTLLGQEVREWCLRVRAAGMRGFYLPSMVIYHKIPVERLNKAYFRRSFYWRGVSRAILYQLAGADMEWPEARIIERHAARQLAGMPRYIYRQALTSAWRYLEALRRRDSGALLDQELQLCFYAGIFAETWRPSR